MAEFQCSSSIIIEEIYTDLQANLLRYAFKHLNNITEAEDAVQTSILKFIQAFHRLSDLPRDSLESYLYIITRNTVYDMLRVHTSKISIDEFEQCDIKCDVEHLAEVHLSYETLLQCMPKLSPKYAGYITMKHFAGLEDEIIAKALDVKVNSVRMIGTRARNALRKMCEKEEGVAAK